MTAPLSSLDLAKHIRLAALDMVAATNSSHIGSGLSAADILAVLYTDILRHTPADPADPMRDRFILSKGHAVAVLYATLAERGFFPKQDLARFAQKDGLPGHASHHVRGIEASTGSLGHGLPIACGMALAAQQQKAPWRSFVLIGDGETTEGSVWEAMLFAPQHHLNNLCVIVDNNRLFSCGRAADVIDLTSLTEKARTFGWDAEEVNGHDHDALRQALSRTSDKPRFINALTIKGKGVPFMEGRIEWHFKSPNADQLAEAKKAVEADHA